MIPRILIVDDEERWRETLNDIIVTVGCEADAFETFNEVKNSLKTNKYDLALLDIDLKSSESYLEFELICKVLYDQSPQTLIVAISGKPIDPLYMFNLPKLEGIKGFVSKNDKNLMVTLQKLIRSLVPLQADIESDELDYPIEKQEWYITKFPPTIEIDKDKINRISDEIDIVIMTATEVEIKAAVRFLKPDPIYESIILAFEKSSTYYLGVFGKYKVAITKCRMGYTGPGAATLACRDACEFWKPKAVIMTGIAFGKDAKRQKIGDVLIASEIIPYGAQRVGKTNMYRGQNLSSNTILLNRFDSAFNWIFSRPDGKVCERFVGPILSGEKLVDDLHFKEILFQQFPNAIGGEMEGAGFAAACEQSRVPWILVKAICDWGDGTKQDNHQAFAAAASDSLVHHVLSYRGALDSL